MDPLSVTASVIACIQLSGKLFEYLGPSKRSAKDLEQLHQSLFAFRNVCKQLKLHLEYSEEDEARLSALQHLQQPLRESARALERIEAKLNGFKFMGKYLIGNSGEEELKKCLQRLDDVKRVFELALHADQHTILTAIERYVRNVAEDVSDTKTVVNENGKRLREIHNELEMHEKIGRIRHVDVKETIQQSRAELIADQRRVNILQWLSHTDPKTNHSEARSQCEDGTGSWFIKGKEYHEWKSTSSSFLWINGIPGCGKTVLCSTIIQNLMDSNEIPGSGPPNYVLFYYFSFQDSEKQCLLNFLVSVLKQLASQYTDIPAALETLYEKCSNEKPTVDQTLPVLKSLLQETDNYYLIVDALDECPRTPQRVDVLTGLSSLAAWKIPGLHIMVTSRKEPDIEVALNCLLDTPSTGIQAAQIDADIHIFVENQLRTHPQLRKWPTDLKDEIKSTLVAGADGMFRWVSCQLDSLAKCLKPAHIRKVLKSLPQTLDDTYARILQNVDEMYVQEVTTALHWLSFSMRPLSPQELAEAAVIDPDEDIPFDRFRDSGVILELLSSLISVSAREGVPNEVRLSHFTVKEYLISNRILSGSTSKFQIQELSAHKTIFDISLRYIAMFEKLQASETVPEELPLWLYACQFWYRHMNLIPEDNLTTYAVSRATKILRSVNWAKSLDPYHDQSSFEKCSPLCYSARLGLAPTTRRLLQEGTDSNEECHHCGHPLIVAIDRNSRKVVQILLEHGADIANPARPWTALHMAAYYGNQDSARLLIDSGAEIEATDEIDQLHFTWLPWEEDMSSAGYCCRKAHPWID